jgi:IS30 family transposase
MKGYKQLTKIQRYQIESLKKADMQQKDIALIIGVSTSALSRELSRNCTDKLKYFINRPLIIIHII